MKKGGKLLPEELLRTRIAPKFLSRALHQLPAFRQFLDQVIQDLSNVFQG